MKKGIYLNDSIHGLIPLSEYEKRIISSIGFNRLHDVYQNSTVYLTFPTNRTKRFEHSIGTMKLCSDMLFSSILNASEKNLEMFYKIFQVEYEKIIKTIALDRALCEQKLGGIFPTEMPPVEFDKFRHSLIPNNVPQECEILHLLIIQSIRVAALLHDIGHPPFSHIVEYALKSVYYENKDVNFKKNKKIENYLQTMSRYFEDCKKLHEQMGDEISDSILREVVSNVTDDEVETYNENLFELLILESVKKIFNEVSPFSYLHRIVDSSLDGDRLDYVTRDSLNSGINSGKIDYNRIINDMQLIVDNGEILFCVPLKAINSVEDFIKRRYNIYKDIIYHHRVIKTDYLLEYSVKDLVNKYLHDEEQYDNDKKLLIPYDISGLWFPLGETTTVEKSNALSQWNDSWLMTILKQIYYTEYYRNKSIKRGSIEYILQQRLSELLRNTKCYYSLIKRSENFKVIDDAVKGVFSGSKHQIDTLVKKVNELAQKSIFTKNSQNITINIKGTLDFIDEIFGNTQKMPNGFVLAYIARRYSAIRIESFKKLVEEIVQSETKNEFTNIELYDTITVFKSISIGLDKPIYFYDYTSKVYTLDEISGISNILRLDSNYLPVFYIYILVKNGDTVVGEKREALLTNIGKAIGEQLEEKIETELKLLIDQMEVK